MRPVHDTAAFDRGGDGAQRGDMTLPSPLTKEGWRKLGSDRATCGHTTEMPPHALSVFRSPASLPVLFPFSLHPFWCLSPSTHYVQLQGSTWDHMAP